MEIIDKLRDLNNGFYDAIEGFDKSFYETVQKVDDAIFDGVESLVGESDFLNSARAASREFNQAVENTFGVPAMRELDNKIFDFLDANVGDADTAACVGELPQNKNLMKFKM